MKRELLKFAMMAVLVPTCASLSTFAQNSTKGQVKDTGTEVGKAGKSLGHNIKHGRVIRGGKHFGKHMGRAGKHVGRAGKHVGHRTKHIVKHVVS